MAKSYQFSWQKCRDAALLYDYVTGKIKQRQKKDAPIFNSECDEGAHTSIQLIEPYMRKLDSIEITLVLVKRGRRRNKDMNLSGSTTKLAKHKKQTLTERKASHTCVPDN